jgi:15-hydroxyprostaglandin dehydrogenase (NAD)
MEILFINERCDPQQSDARGAACLATFSRRLSIGIVHNYAATSKGRLHALELPHNLNTLPEGVTIRAVTVKPKLRRGVCLRRKKHCETSERVHHEPSSELTSFAVSEPVKGSSPFNSLSTKMSTQIPTKTAIVTGACSGIGLALTHHLLSSQAVRWRVALADINEESYEKVSSSLDSARTLFQRTDVSSWEDNAVLFKRVFEWSAEENAEDKGKIDLFVANAGIDDKESVFAQFDLEAEPAKPDLRTIEVDFLSAFYGLKVFIHYARKTRASLPPSASFTPAVIITASAAGLYPFPINAQYCAAKHGLVGLTRSVGPPLLAQDNLSVNAILPGLVPTGLAPPWLIAQCPQEVITPMSTILQAYDDLMKEETVDGTLKRKTGQCLEAAENKLYYREAVDYPSDGQRWLMDELATGRFMIAAPQPKQEQNGQ